MCNKIIFSKTAFELIVLAVFSLIIVSCSSKENKVKSTESTKALTKENLIEDKQINKTKLTFEETQDSLRKVLLNSKPNEKLKESILQELYIKGLVNQVDDKIKFQLSFNLHGFDCGAPDCYSTDITFDIPVTEPISFPQKIEFQLLEYGCVNKEVSINGIFELVEKSSEYVNYYSKKHKSNLIIIGDKRQLYYFPNTTPSQIKVESIDKIFEEYNDEDPNTTDLYRSTVMITHEYDFFITNN